jgi:hypothetical protein
MRALIAQLSSLTERIQNKSCEIPFREVFGRFEGSFNHKLTEAEGWNKSCGQSGAADTRNKLYCPNKLQLTEQFTGDPFLDEVLDSESPYDLSRM